MLPRFIVDANDPRAPSQELWNGLTAEERAEIVAQLPSELPRASPPEGDPHRIPKERARQVLEGHFRRIGRRVYLSSELPVYYPGESMFAPDLIAVLDTEPHERLRWVVAAEQRGIDLALEITLEGDRRKDLVENVARCARLGISEYFVLDLRERRLIGYRLPRLGAAAYERIVPQAGCWASGVLGLELGLAPNGRRLRFFYGGALVEEAEELAGRMSRMVDTLVQREEERAAREEALVAELAQERSAKEAERAAKEAERAAKEEALADVASLEARLRELERRGG